MLSVAGSKVRRTRQSPLIFVSAKSLHIALLGLCQASNRATDTIAGDPIQAL
jgi:hypothetical protein